MESLGVRNEAFMVVKMCFWNEEEPPIYRKIRFRVTMIPLMSGSWLEAKQEKKKKKLFN